MVGQKQSLPLGYECEAENDKEDSMENGLTLEALEEIRTLTHEIVEWVAVLE